MTNPWKWPNNSIIKILAVLLAWLPNCWGYFALVDIVSRFIEKNYYSDPINHSAPSSNCICLSGHLFSSCKSLHCSVPSSTAFATSDLAWSFLVPLIEDVDEGYFILSLSWPHLFLLRICCTALELWLWQSKCTLLLNQRYLIKKFHPLSTPFIIITSFYMTRTNVCIRRHHQSRSVQYGYHDKPGQQVCVQLHCHMVDSSGQGSFKAFMFISAHLWT